MTRGRGRRYLFRGPRRFRLKIPCDPRPRWNDEREAFTVKIPDKDGSVEEREFLLEGTTKVVEGPKGWQRGATAGRRGGTVWHELRRDPRRKSESKQP